MTRGGPREGGFQNIAAVLSAHYVECLREATSPLWGRREIVAIHLAQWLMSGIIVDNVINARDTAILRVSTQSHANRTGQSLITWLKCNYPLRASLDIYQTFNTN